MKRSEMTCSACVKFENGRCRLNPIPQEIGQPCAHWCAQGEWRQWSQRYEEMEPFFWAEWEPEGVPS